MHTAPTVITGRCCSTDGDDSITSVADKDLRRLTLAESSGMQCSISLRFSVATPAGSAQSTAEEKVDLIGNGPLIVHVPEATEAVRAASPPAQYAIKSSELTASLAAITPCFAVELEAASATGEYVYVVRFRNNADGSTCILRLLRSTTVSVGDLRVEVLAAEATIPAPAPVVSPNPVMPVCVSKGKARRPRQSDRVVTSIRTESLQFPMSGLFSPPCERLSSTGSDSSYTTSPTRWAANDFECSEFYVVDFAAPGVDDDNLELWADLNLGLTPVATTDALVPVPVSDNLCPSSCPAPASPRSSVVSRPARRTRRTRKSSSISSMTDDDEFTVSSSSDGDSDWDAPPKCRGRRTARSRPAKRSGGRRHDPSAPKCLRTSCKNAGYCQVPASVCVNNTPPATPACQNCYVWLRRHFLLDRTKGHRRCNHRAGVIATTCQAIIKEFEDGGARFISCDDESECSSDAFATESATKRSRACAGHDNVSRRSSKRQRRSQAVA